METLIGIFTAVLDFFSAVKTFFAGLGRLFQDFDAVEMWMAGVMLAVAVSGMGAFGPWTRKRRSGEFPWR
ncbi:MAG: hypothetical protein B7Z37_28950 [Verrucomicrobia bacterium 12-59-8]|nr:MAG: hypothetical protein B7Z37_28950 [Verrucomicrobia bacterium 12-59-8]